MATTHERLHAIVDQLSDATAEEALNYLHKLGNGANSAEEGSGENGERPPGPPRLSGREFRTRPHRSLHELALEQGVKPIAGLDSLRADFWPEDESIDDFLEAVQAWRRSG